MGAGIPRIKGAGGIPRPQQGGGSTTVHGQPKGSTMMPNGMLGNLKTQKKGDRKSVV
jgi:hypothetical protein